MQKLVNSCRGIKQAFVLTIEKRQDIHMRFVSLSVGFGLSKRKHSDSITSDYNTYIQKSISYFSDLVKFSFKML